MTLEEAIKHAKEQSVNASCEACRQEHLQLAIWLENYKRLKDQRTNDVDVFEKVCVTCGIVCMVAFTSIVVLFVIHLGKIVFGG